MKVPHLKTEPKFSTNPNRVLNRTELVQFLQTKFLERPQDHWLKLLNENGGIPYSPINDIRGVFQDEYTFQYVPTSIPPQKDLLVHSFDQKIFHIVGVKLHVEPVDLRAHVCLGT